MAESQIMCMDDGHVNEKTKDSNPEFYYSEEQRAALEELLRNGDGAFKDRLKEDDTKDFLSAREIKSIRKTFQEYRTDSEDDPDLAPAQTAKGDSGIHSTYWPQLSDVDVPSLDIGWPDGVSYKGVTRVTVHTNPPKADAHRIKQVVRKLIQESSKVVAVVMDLLTDLQILQDLLDAACKRKVSVYILLDAAGVPHFLDMCSRLQVSTQHLKNIRVRMVRGTGLLLSFGKLPGSMCSKYMLVDGDKVMFGSYGFTWSSSRIDRNTILVMTGHVVDIFDRDFRELYAASENVDLYDELHVARPPKPKPAPMQPKAAPPPPTSTSRFKVSLGDHRDVAKIPPHKYYNPKYLLVVGNNAGATASLKTLPSDQTSPAGPDSESIMHKFLKADSERPGQLPSPPATPTDTEGKEGSKKPNGLLHAGKKPSIRNILKIKTSSLNARDSDDSSTCSSPTRSWRKSPKLSPKRLTMETSFDESQESKFSKEASEGSPQVKVRTRTLSRGSRNTSPQTGNAQEEDATKAQKKGCILS